MMESLKMVLSPKSFNIYDQPSTHISLHDIVKYLGIISGKKNII